MNVSRFYQENFTSCNIEYIEICISPSIFSILYYIYSIEKISYSSIDFQLKMSNKENPKSKRENF